jgi:hypothetical protein
MSLSAARDATHSIENRSARVPGLLPHIYRGTFSSDGDFYLYEDNDVRIGYQQAGDAVILIYSPKADTVGGHTSFEKEREVGPGKLVYQAWDGTATQTAGTLYAVGSDASPTTPPTTAPSNVINRTQIGEVVAVIALGQALDRFYEIKVIVHQASAAGTYSYLWQVVKRHGI